MKPLFLANHPAIDFLNTNLAPDGRSIELLGTGTEYVEWLMAANLLDKKRALDLTRRASGKALDSAAEEARRVREWMRAWLTRWRSNPEGDYRCQSWTDRRSRRRTGFSGWSRRSWRR